MSVQSMTTSRIFTPLAAAAALVLLAAAPQAQAINVVVSGTANGPVETFLNANFSNITSLKSGDYSNFAGNPA